MLDFFLNYFIWFFKFRALLLYSNCSYKDKHLCSMLILAL